LKENTPTLVFNFFSGAAPSNITTTCTELRTTSVKETVYPCIAYGLLYLFGHQRFNCIA
jgi:hypothetical protein